MTRRKKKGPKEEGNRGGGAVASSASTHQRRRAEEGSAAAAADPPSPLLEPLLPPPARKAPPRPPAAEAAGGGDPYPSSRRKREGGEEDRKLLPAASVPPSSQAAPPPPPPYFPPDDHGRQEQSPQHQTSLHQQPPVPGTSETAGRGQREIGNEDGADIDDDDRDRGDSAGGDGVPRRRRRNVRRRVLDRDAPFFQSRGRWQIRHVARREASVTQTPEGRRVRTSLRKRLWDGWFHFLAYQKTVVLMFLLFLSYASIVFAFGFVYLGVSKWGQRTSIDPDDGSATIQPFCDMDIHNHMEALYFSLSTMTTIGYGVSDYYFGGCWTPLLLVLAQVCCAITFDAVAIGLIFQRISRGHKRAKTVLFSDSAVVRIVGGIPHLMVRVGELRRHQLLRPTVQAYCVRHERHPMHMNPAENRSSSNEAATMEAPPPPIELETAHHATFPMRLLGGGDVMMSLPQVLVHRIDDSSPLMPPARGWYDRTGHLHRRTSNRQQHQQEHGGGSDAGDGGDGGNGGSSSLLEDMSEFLLDRDAEIVLLLDGTDELTGAVSQTRHSYTVDDVRYNERFVSCVHSCLEDDEYSEGTADGDGDGAEIDAGEGGGWFRGGLRRRRTRGRSGVDGRGGRRWWRRRQQQPACVVDFALFHDTAPALADCYSCPYVPER